MTREEAIQILTRAKPILATEELKTALDMAIEALSADAVSRETYHNLVTASNDIDKALREYQDKEEKGELVSVVRCKDCRYLNRKVQLAPKYYLCTKHTGEHGIQLDDYCSWGE